MSILLICTAAPGDHSLVSRHIAHASRTTWSSSSRIVHVELHAEVHSNMLMRRQVLAKTVRWTTSVGMKARLDNRKGLYIHKSDMRRLKTLSAAQQMSDRGLNRSVSILQYDCEDPSAVQVSRMSTQVCNFSAGSHQTWPSDQELGMDRTCETSILLD